MGSKKGRSKKDLKGKAGKGQTRVAMAPSVSDEDLALPMDKVAEIVKDITPQQANFAQDFVRHFNITRAARNSGYSPKTSAQQGNALLKNPKVREAIGKLLTIRGEKLGLTAEWVLEQLKLAVEIGLAKAEFETRNGDETVKRKTLDLGPAIRALELLGKNMSLWVDKVDHTSTDGSMSPARITEEMDAKVAAEKYAELIKRR